MKQTSMVRKGDIVIWMQGGQEGLADGMPAIVHHVYPGGVTLDLVVQDASGNPLKCNVVEHVSSRDEMSEGHLRQSGVWTTIEDHHELYEKAEADRLKRIDAARKAASKAEKDAVLS